MPAIAQARELPRINRPLLRFFRFITRGYLKRHFTAMRFRGAHRLAELGSVPLIIYGNHASWWDPLVSIHTAATALPHRRHYAPMEAAALARYRIFRRLGVFPVDLDTPRGAANFLRTGESILRSGGVLWVVPQGRFADPRERPLVLRPGLAALLARVPETTVLPMAVEYPFWDQRLPEVLAEIGPPLRSVGPRISTSERLDRDAIHDELTEALTRTMDSLAQAAQTRDPNAFDQVLLHGNRGTGGFYALGERARALLTRRPYRPEHTRHSASGNTGGPSQSA